MSVGLATILAGILTVGVTSLTTLWHKRSGSPEGLVQTTTAATMMFTTMSDRIRVLENRIEMLEAEVSAYYHLHGPLRTAQEYPYNYPHEEEEEEE